MNIDENSNENMIHRTYATAKNSVKYSLNYFVKHVENGKALVEKQIDKCNKKMIVIIVLMTSFIVWYIRRVCQRNNRKNMKNREIYFMESGYRSKGDDDTPIVYDYFNNNVVYLYNSKNNEKFE